MPTDTTKVVVSTERDKRKTEVLMPKGMMRSLHEWQVGKTIRGRWGKQSLKKTTSFVEDHTCMQLEIVLQLCYVRERR